MRRRRSGRRVAVATALGASLMAASAGSQAVFVDVKAGDDGNFGEKPRTPVHTITRALEVASRNLAIPWTIWVAGRVDEEGAVLAYDDDPATAAPSRESFPLPVLPGVSLVWDRAHSDVVLLGPDLVRSAFGLAVLAESSRHPFCSDLLPEEHLLDPADRTVTLRGLDFEEGSPALSIADRPGAPVSVLLEDLRVRDSQGCLEVAASRSPLALEIRACRFELLPPAPRVTPPVQFLVNVGATGTGWILGTIEGCTFRKHPAMRTEAKAQFVTRGDGSLTFDVRNCLFEDASTRRYRRIEF